MSLNTVAFRDITFRHATAPTNLFNHLSVYFSKGFTGVVGPNGAGKTSLLQLACGLLIPDDGAIECSSEAVYCAQRTDEKPGDLVEFLNETTSSAFALRAKLGIEWDFSERWQTLSHGERKRAQIGCLLWRDPPVLAIDEPTNHIDHATRDTLIAALRGYRGVGLIVSHDRDLLDELCHQCLWLEPPQARLFQGGYTEANQQRGALRGEAQRSRHKAVANRDKVRRETIKRREQLEKSHKARSKSGISNKDHDAKEKINRAIVTDSGSGKRLRQLGGHLARAEADVADTRVSREFEVGIWLPGSISKRDMLFTLAAGQIPLGGDRVLSHPEISMQPQQRVALTGNNGLGKSTLISQILRQVNVPEAHLTVMPQELTTSQSTTILNEVRQLPKNELGHLMNIVSRLGSRPARLLESELPSPGEIRKLLLALGMSRVPHFLILDEPTNHLDLPSVEALEDALSGCPCGMLLVSHDQRFLTRLADVSWHLEEDEMKNVKLTVK
jgi:macrolide transport system ATP-binding/permease protein